MTSSTSSNPIEDKLYAATRVPQPRPEFLAELRARLADEAKHPTEPARRVSFGESIKMAFRRPVWVVAIIVLFLLVGILGVVGPQRVLAAFRQLFGYIPGVGIVDQSAPIRVLAEPVSLTRDGITLEVTSGTLTGDQTHIEYRSFGVPGTAYPDREDVVGCLEREYLRLPDGTKIEVEAPIPANMNEATFVLPCIFNTLPGTVPTDWELPLKFVAAPPEMTVMPVTELSPTPETNPVQDTVVLEGNSTVTPAAPEDHAVTVSKEIETEDGYILVGSFQPQTQAGERIQATGATLTDASGKEIPYTHPMDVSPDSPDPNVGGSGWATQFKGRGLVYPLTITFTGVPVHEADPSATAEFTFDAGSNPQPGQEWMINQDIHLAGYALKLVSITADSRGGYSFRFQGDKVYGVGVQIAGFTATGGGGGSSPGGMVNVSKSYAQLPTGVLKVILSHLTVTSDPLTWQGQWSPANPRTDFPTPQPGVCLDASSLAGLNPIPPELARGEALVYEQLEGSDQWGLVLYSLDGSAKQVVAANAAWGALSPDGSQVAYSPFSKTAVDIHIMDLNSQSVRTLTGIFGTGYHWSPDGQQIAYIASGGNAINGVSVVNADGSNNRQVSDLSYATLLGWSADGARLYFAAPYIGGAAWKVYAFDLANGATQELFTIENGTRKFLNPNLSPDGQWIAYRGRDNSSLYLVRLDGSDMHLMLDNIGVTSNEWSSSGWLGASLRVANTDDRTLLLVKPAGCQAYRLPELSGELQGLFIP